MIKKASVPAKWLLSYLLLLLVPIIIFMCFFVMQQKEVEREIYESNEMVLSSVESNLSNTFDGMRQIFTEICMHKDFQSMLYYFQNNYAEGLLSANRIHRTAQVYITLNNFVDEIYAHDLRSDMAFSTRSGIHKSATINTIVFGDAKADELERFLQEHPYGGFCDLSFSTTLQSRPERSLCFVGLYPFGSTRRTAKCLVVASANMDYIFESTNALLKQSYKGMLFLNEANETIFSSNPDLTIDVAKREKGMYTDHRQVISFLELKEGNWCCAVASPKEIFWRRLHSVRLLMVIGIALCLILGGLCAVFLSRKNYVPLKQTLMLLKSKTGYKGDEKDEYAFLHKSLFEILEANEEQKQKISQQEKYLINKSLLEMLYGRGNVQELEQKTGIRVSAVSDRYILAVCDASDYAVLFEEEEDLTAGKRRELLSFLIDNVMSELAEREGYVCYTLNVEDTIVLVINLTPNAVNAQQKIIDLCNTCNGVFGQEFKYPLRVAVSEICLGESNLSHMYYEAAETMDFLRLNAMSGVFCCNELRKESTAIYNAESEYQLISAICEGDCEKTRKVLDTIFKSGEKTVAASVKCRIVELTAAMIKLADDAEQKRELAENCTQRCEVTEMKRKIYESAEKLCLENKEKLSRKSGGAVDRIKKYIDEHYKDSMLSVQLLEEKIGLSRYHMTRIFKAAYGLGILEYIKEVRVEQAKAYIKDNINANMETVAAEVGFNDSRALTRAFRQKLGITPAEYRRTLNK